MRQIIVWITVSFIFLSLSSCTNSKLRKEFDEGYIEYTITYDSTLFTKYDPDLLPKTMLVKFYKNGILNKVEGLSGAVILTNIINKELQKNIILVKLMNKRLYYEEPIVEGKYPITYLEMPKLSILKSDKTSKFNGIKCKHAQGTFLDSTNLTFDILYTKEIKIDNPNANSPYESIDGIMLKFNMKLFNKNMTLTAKKIKSTNIATEEFRIPADYERVTDETIQDVITLLR